MLVAALVMSASAQLPLQEALATARRDEASLPAKQANEFFDRQDKIVGSALVACGVSSAQQAAGILVVLKLDQEGNVVETWLEKASKIGTCFEKELRKSRMPADGRAEFYTFVHFDF